MSAPTKVPAGYKAPARPGDWKYYDGQRYDGRPKWRTIRKCAHDSRDEHRGRAMCEIRAAVGPCALVWIFTGWNWGSGHGEPELYLTLTGNAPQTYRPIRWIDATEEQRAAALRGRP